ncbi:ead/Ea22-like family protein [Salmonella enterica]|nr:ead/Ea22-like family protein [Salmonella enterica]EMC5619604.1 ead/Ea22-like family protein [Salmonella enterica]
MSNIDKQALLVSKAKASVFTMGYISQFEASDIDSDDIYFRFEVDAVETGTTVSIVDECGHAAQIITALLDELEKAQRANVAQDDHINQQQDRIEQLEKGHQEAAKQINSWRRLAKQNIAERGKDISELEAARQRIAEQSAIVAAAEKLVRCKGRYHSELNYRALAKLFGVNTPDLPPMDGESRTVMMPEPFKMAKSSSGLMYYYADEVDKALASAGIKVKE